MADGTELSNSFSDFNRAKSELQEKVASLATCAVEIQGKYQELLTLLGVSSHQEAMDKVKELKARKPKLVAVPPSE
jgi:hypothetical protein